MELSLLTQEKELKQIRELESILISRLVECARGIYKANIERIDDLSRRYYRYPDGTYHYPLDELSGMEKYRHTTAAMAISEKR